MPSIAILGSGNGSNAQALIDAVEAGTLPVQIRCILSDVQDARILERARNHNIPAHFIDCTPSKSLLHQTAEAEVIQRLADYEVDYVILAGFMRIIKQGLLDAYPRQIINIHPSLLPAFPGLDAGRQAFQANVSETGCTIHYVDAGIDTGDIILQKKISIDATDTLESLMQKIHTAEHIAYPEALNRLFNLEINR
jgi:phosphoribosylglycinamide formyltransferase-1